MHALKILAPAAALGTLLALPLNAVAQDNFRPGFYLGGGIGYDRVEGEDFTGNGDDLEDSRVTYKGIVGYRIARMFSLEGQYINFGTNEDGNNRVKADGFTAGVVLDIPITENFAPYAKAGALFWDADSRFGPIAGQLSRNTDGTDFTYGVGARFALNESINLRLEYERFELDETDVDMGTVALQFNF